MRDPFGRVILVAVMSAWMGASAAPKISHQVETFWRISFALSRR